MTERVLMNQSCLCANASLFPQFRAHWRVKTQPLCRDTRAGDVVAIHRRESTIKTREIDCNFNNSAEGSSVLFLLGVCFRMSSRVTNDTL